MVVLTGADDEQLAIEALQRGAQDYLVKTEINGRILSRAIRYAVERNSSVNALVREYLTNIAQHQDRARRARIRLRQLSKKSQGQLSKKAWTREDLHER